MADVAFPTVSRTRPKIGGVTPMQWAKLRLAPPVLIIMSAGLWWAIYTIARAVL